MGYAPNPMVSALMSQVAKGRVVNQGVVIGVLVDEMYDPDSRKDPDEYQNTIYQGALLRLKELGCSYEKFVFTNRERDQLRIDQILKARGIAGLLLPSVYRVGHIPKIDFKRTTVVTSGYSLQGIPVHRVVPDQFGAMKLALEECKRRGYRRPAFYTHRRLNERVMGLEHAAFLSECVRHFPEVDIHRAVSMGSSWGEAALKRLVMETRADVIISNNPEACGMLAKLGWQVPDDIAFLRLGHYGDPNQSHTDLNGHVIGSWMVDLLTASLNRNEVGLPPLAKRLVVPPKFVEGATLRKGN
jgi:DNA-binding LacI/PurR family transcriptional regulator